MPTDFDEHGQWIGTCKKCGTNHEGYPPDTVGAGIRCARAFGLLVGSADLVAMLSSI